MRRAGLPETNGLGCVGKKAFANYTAAVRATRTLRRSQDVRGTSVYRCRVCLGWHVGTGSRTGTGPVRGRLNHRGEYVEPRPRLSEDDAAWLAGWAR